jgi:uncharacterized protein YndB with AHSA1/START domain
MSDEFVLTRTFNAPRALVWKAFTDREALAQWMGPKGDKVVSNTLDLRPGGIYHYGFESAERGAYWGKWTFVEIVPLEKLVARVAFSDANGGITRHPMAPDWPAETLSVTTFEDAGANRTKITLRWSAYNASEKEKALFDSSHASMNQGWSGTMEQLEAYLAQAQAH